MGYYVYMDEIEAEAEQAAILDEAIWGFGADYTQFTSPIQYHGFVQANNLDEDAEPLRWIIERPDCDIATAYLIYWNIHPGTPPEPGQEPEEYDFDALVVDIQEKVKKKGFVESGLLRFDLAEHGHHPESDEFKQLVKDARIPDYMCRSFEGRRVRTDLPVKLLNCGPEGRKQIAETFGRPDFEITEEETKPSKKRRWFWQRRKEAEPTRNYQQIWHFAEGPVGWVVWDGVFSFDDPPQCTDVVAVVMDPRMKERRYETLLFEGNYRELPLEYRPIRSGREEETRPEMVVTD